MATKAEIRKLAKEIREHKKVTLIPDIRKENDVLKIGEKTYDSWDAPTIQKAIDNTHSPLVAVVGPFGSGKSVGMCVKAICYKACQMPLCLDSKRHYRLLVSRQTYPELTSTTIRTFLDWFGDIGVKMIEKTKKMTYSIPPEYEAVMCDEYGKIHIHVIFIAVAKFEDLKKLNSFEPTDCYINEAGELESVEVINTISSRKGRYPSMAQIDFRRYAIVLPTKISNYPKNDLIELVRYNNKWIASYLTFNQTHIKMFVDYEDIDDFKNYEKHLLNKDIDKLTQYEKKELIKTILLNPQTIIDSNPTPKDHFFYEVFIENCPPRWEVYRQPAGIIRDEDGEWYNNPERENRSNLPTRYYLDMTEGTSKEFIQVRACGEFADLSGNKLVYADYFNYDLHVSSDAEYDKTFDIMLGWDFGRTPCCIFVQLLPSGRLIAFDEIVSEDTDITTLANNVFWPHYMLKYQTSKIASSRADPAGDHPEQGENKSCIQRLNDNGIYTSPAEFNGQVTNAYQHRLGSVKKLLSTLVHGKPQLQIHPRCKNLIAGFTREYYYERVKASIEKVHKNVPKKTHPYSDIHDGLQYIAMEVVSQLGQILINVGKMAHVNY